MFILLVWLFFGYLVQVQSDVPDTVKGSWYGSVLEYRQRVLDHLADMPSLKGFWVAAVETADGDGRKLAMKQGELAKLGMPLPEESKYPASCPFSMSQILDEDFYGL